MHQRHFTGEARATRGVVLGTALFVLTAAGHSAADGHPTTLTGTLWLLPIMILLSAVLADRRRSVAWLFAFLLGAELLFHVVLSLSLGHDGHAVADIPSAAMVIAHVLAAAVAGAAIHEIDDLVHRWLAFVDVVLRGPHFTTVEIADAPQRPSAPAPLDRPRLRSAHAYRLRGPPVITA